MDSVSTLNLYLNNSSALIGAINSDGSAGDVYVELSNEATWTLTRDSYITSLTCDEDSINLNGFTLYVNGEAYESGNASTGTKVDAKVSSGSEGMDKPDGEHPQGDKPDGEPPEGGKPDGVGQHGGKPDGEP